jgi:hypothetical protein
VPFVVGLHLDSKVDFRKKFLLIKKVQGMVMLLGFGFEQTDIRLKRILIEEGKLCELEYVVLI